MNKIVHLTLLASSLVTLNIHSGDRSIIPPLEPPNEIFRAGPSRELEIVEVVEEAPKPQLTSKQIATTQAAITKHQAEIDKLQPQIDLLRAQREKETKGSSSDKQMLQEIKKLIKQKTTLAKKIREREERLTTPEIYLAKAARPEAIAHRKERMKTYNKEYNARPEVIAHRKEHAARPEVRAYQKKYEARPEVRTHRKEYAARKRQKIN